LSPHHKYLHHCFNQSVFNRTFCQLLRLRKIQNNTVSNDIMSNDTSSFMLNCFTLNVFMMNVIFADCHGAKRISSSKDSFHFIPLLYPHKEGKLGFSFQTLFKEKRFFLPLTIMTNKLERFPYRISLQCPMFCVKGKGQYKLSLIRVKYMSLFSRTNIII
jgi:hypothetical protein